MEVWVIQPMRQWNVPKGEIDILGPAMEVAKELTSVPDFSSADTSQPLAAEKATLRNLKKVFLMIGGKAAKDLGTKLDQEQEIMMNLADIMIEIYAAESTLLRTESLLNKNGEEAVKNHIAVTKVYLYEAVEKIQSAGKEAIMSFTKGDEQKMLLMGLKRFTKYENVNTKELRREIAASLISQGKYFFFHA